MSGQSTTSPRSPLSRAPRAAYQEMKLCAAKRGMARCGAMPPAALASGATPGAEVSDYRSPGCSPRPPSRSRAGTSASTGPRPTTSRAPGCTYGRWYSRHDRRTVPVDTSDTLRAANPHLVAEVRVPGADHVKSWNAAPATYQAPEATFLCVTTALAAICNG